MTIRCRVHSRGNETLVAACDEDLVGHTFREGELKLAIEAAFYGEETVDGEELVARLRQATIANLAGEETVETAVEAGFIDPEHVLVIDGVPHAQLAVML